MNNKKIAIFTYWWSEDNYGQMLQAFALQTYLKSCGYDSEIVRYRKTKRTIYDHLVLLLKRFLDSFLKTNYLAREDAIPQDVKDLGFQLFRDSVLRMSLLQYDSLRDLRKLPPEAETYICGSDKIWATYPRDIFRTDVFDAFTLNFGRSDKKRIAYAPSIGKGEISNIAARRFLRNLKRFDGISVREKSAAELLSTIGIDGVVWVPDPTQLIGSEGYLRFIDSNPTKYQKTWFFYGLNNPSYITSNQIAKELLSKGVDFAYTGANGNTDDLINCYPTIPEWLNYMYYAKNVITNSYHGCIFCILFHKNFYYIPVLPDKNGLPDERVLSIMNRYEIQDRAIQTLEELQQVITNPYKPIDWDSVDAKREEFVQVGKDFLAKHLGDSTT
jgi:hypothetical protein